MSEILLDVTTPGLEKRFLLKKCTIVKAYSSGISVGYNMKFKRGKFISAHLISKYIALKMMQSRVDARQFLQIGAFYTT